jgi:hypothetical protein
LGVSEAGTLQHATQVNHLLSVDAFVLGRLKALSLVPEGDVDSPVVSLFDLSHRLKQRDNRPPLNVVAYRVLEDLGDGFPMVPAQVIGLVWGRCVVSVRGASGWCVMLREHG